MQIIDFPMAAFSFSTTDSSSAKTCSFRTTSTWSLNLFAKAQEGVFSRDKNVANEDSKNNEEDQVLHVN